MSTLHDAADYGGVIDRFLAAMAEYGLETSDTIIDDGKLHRFKVKGDRDKTGWYVLHNDNSPVAQFGCNKRYGDEKLSWVDKVGRRKLTPEERRAFAQKMQQQEEQRAADERVRHEMAKARAEDIWKAGKVIQEDDDHDYLIDKGVYAYGLRRGRWEYVSDEGEISLVSDDALLIPVRDRTGTLHSLQGIFPNSQNFLKRNKDYLKNGAKRGLFHAIGKPKPREANGPLVFILCEGYATGASIHYATSHCVLVCFDAGNLMPVAQSIRDSKPDAIIVIAADNDQWTTRPIPNPGLTKGREVALSVFGHLAFPDFPASTGMETIIDGTVKIKGPTDFNDLQHFSSVETVAHVIEQAMNAGPLKPDAFASTAPEPVALLPERVAPVDLHDDSALEELPPAAPVDLYSAPLEAVGEHDGDDLERNGYFKVLGYDGGDYYVFNNQKGQVTRLRRMDMTMLGLSELAPSSWWELHFPSSTKGMKMDLLMAAEWIFKRAHSRGIYDPTRVRGRGAWTDEGSAVYHHGPFLTVDGKRTELANFESGYVYPRARELPKPHENPLTAEEGAELVRIASLPRWTMPGSAALMAGWVMLASICGALTWRSHIWITGGAGTGKTTLQKLFCGGLTRGIAIYAQGNSTEAGIRQRLKGDALPVLVDEFESNNEAERRRVENIMSLIRQTSSETQAKTLKGTVNGDGMDFDIRSMFCLSSINTNLPTKADVDRLTILRLRSSKSGGADNWNELEAELNKIDQDPIIARRLLARALNMMATIQASIKVFRKVAGQKFERQRDGDQFGTLLAGCWCLQKDHVPSEQEAKFLIDGYNWSEHREEADEDDAENAKSELLSCTIRVGGGAPDQTVFDLIRESHPTHRTGSVDMVLAETLLRQKGIIADHGNGQLIIGTSVPSLRELTAHMTSSTALRDQLLRSKGADKGQKTYSFNGSKSKVIILPLAPILGDDDPDDDDPF